MAYKNGRINERNAGGWSLDGEPKKRRSRKKDRQLTAEEMALAAELLRKISDCLEFDREVFPARGHLHPAAAFVGYTGFQVTRTQLEILSDIIDKLTDNEA